MSHLIANYTVQQNPTAYASVSYTLYKSWKSHSITVNTTKNLSLNNRVFKLLEEFTQLKDNWDGDDAIAPNSVVISKAKYLTNVLDKRGEPIYHTAPGPNGEVMLDLRNDKKGKAAEIILYANRSVVVTFSQSEAPKQQNFENAHLPEVLEWLNL